MALTPPAEHTPLLPPGFHGVDAHTLEALCVTPFPGSRTRRDIFDGLVAVFQEIESQGLNLDVWIDGSFLTQKEHPNDSDVVVRFPIDLYTSGSPAQVALIDKINANLKATHKCDSYVLPVYPAGHPKAQENDWMAAYWIKQFGFSRGEDMKGIAVYSVTASP